MLITHEAMHAWGPGLSGKSLYRPLNFAMNIKLLYTNKIFIKVNE